MNGKKYKKKENTRKKYRTEEISAKTKAKIRQNNDDDDEDVENF